MKLRFRDNSLRLRINQQEVRALASGSGLKETIYFPENARLSYQLAFTAVPQSTVSFCTQTISVLIPNNVGRSWAESPELGFYFETMASEKVLRVALEKDLECLHEPEEERDPDAFPRTAEL